MSIVIIANMSMIVTFPFEEMSVHEHGTARNNKVKY